MLTQQTIEEIQVSFAGKKIAPKPLVALPLNLKPTAFPTSIAPELATLVNTAPEGPNWLHEIKFDGYRILTFINNGLIALKSRNNLDWTAKFSPIVKALDMLAIKNIILDGEMVVLDKQGKSDFQLLQNSIKNQEDTCFIYYIFDVLYYDQFNLQLLPLIKRKEILRAILPEHHYSLRYSDYILNDGNEIFQHACEMALEGIISKQIDSIYETRRSKSWLKIKCLKRQEFVVGGYTEPQNGRQYFGSLFLGVFNKQGELEYTGNVGTGFTQTSLKEMHEQLQNNVSAQNPFNELPPGFKKAHWLKPNLVVEVEFTEWTNKSHVRHPSFKGLRVDKMAIEVKREDVMQNKKTQSIKKTKKGTLTHPEKILFPEDNYTKQDILDYYDFVSDYILPFIKNRPLTLVRCPENYKACFFQRHYNSTTPKALKLIELADNEDKENYIFLNDKKGLLSLVQMDVLEIHPWNSLVTAIDTPNMMIFDLDPAPDVTWKAIVAAAFEIKTELNQLNLKSFVKTTGGKGLHIVIPIQAIYPWDEIKNFTTVFVKYLEKRKPNQYISKMTKAKRGGKIFIDYLRNQRTATAVSAYSTRARLHAPVSVPLDWDELTQAQQDTNYTIKSLPTRMDSLKTMPWADFWHLQQTLPTV